MLEYNSSNIQWDLDRAEIEQIFRNPKDYPRDEKFDSDLCRKVYNVAFFYGILSSSRFERDAEFAGDKHLFTEHIFLNTLRKADSYREEVQTQTSHGTVEYVFPQLIPSSWNDVAYGLRAAKRGKTTAWLRNARAKHEMMMNDQLKYVYLLADRMSWSQIIERKPQHAYSMGNSSQGTNTNSLGSTGNQSAHKKAPPSRGSRALKRFIFFVIFLGVFLIWLSRLLGG